MMYFVHIPKTGGTSVLQAMPNAQGIQRGHHKVSDVKGVAHGDMWSIIRNPYDRALSLFTQLTPYKADARMFKKMVMDGSLFQSKTLTDTMTNYLSVNGRVVVKELIEFSNLAKEFPALMGIPLPHINKGMRSNGYEDYYDDELREVIYYKYEDDFINFRYQQ